jgi:hypothetical protein
LHLGLVDGVGSSDRGVRRGAPRCARPRPSLLSPAGEPDDRAGYQPGQDPTSGGGEGHDGEPKPSVSQEAGQDEAEAATDLVADRDGIMCLNHRRDYIRNPGSRPLGPELGDLSILGYKGEGNGQRGRRDHEGGPDS